MEARYGERDPTVRHRVEIKLSADQKDTIARGAAIAKESFAEFVRRAAERVARELIAKGRE